MEKMIQGRAWKFGDNVDTDQLCPGHAIVLPMEERKKFALVSLRPAFPENVKLGDILVGGANFGCGSSREQAADVLQALGLAAVIAESFGRIFYRNAVAIGLPVLICPNLAENVSDGDLLEIKLHQARSINHASGRELQARSLPPELLEIIMAGGIINMLKAAQKKA